MKALTEEKVPDSPLFVAEIKDPAFELQGWVVVHTLGTQGSCGGVRLYPDVSREEVELLARAMSYKYCFHEVTMGGAKAGVRLPFGTPLADRATILRKFGEHIGPLIRSRIYRPWTDMNCSADDIMHIYQGAGIRIGTPLSNSAYFTALSTFSAVVAAAEYYQIEPEQCKITIEGLGNVGRYLAIQIERWGGKLIGASSLIGAVANLKGLDVKQILKTLEKSNDFWVKENGDWEIISKEQLFSLPMNIHIPCARVHSVTERVVKDLNCRAIVPAANVPCTPEAELKINEKGIKLLPDFVVNSGGILGPGFSCKDFKDMIGRLLKLTEINQTSATRLACLECHKNFRSLSMSGREKTKRDKGIFRSLMRRVHIAKKIVLKKRTIKINRIIRERFR